MPRPRAFDTEAALDAALATFWRLGYEATTLTDLTDAMGIARPSLYNAFGDKRALFLAAVDRYAGLYAPLLAALEDEPDGPTAVRAFLLRAAGGLGDRNSPPGCFRVAHTATLSDRDPVLAEALASAHYALEAAFEARLTRAWRDGQLAAHESPASLAAFFVGVLGAMSVRARVDPDERALGAIAERAMRAWPAP